MKREINYNIEFMRVLGCFMVVCIHVANYYSRGYGQISQASYLFSLIVNGVCRIAVPIFFMISGALLIPETLLIRKSIRRSIHILLALVLWSVIYYFWNIYYRNDVYQWNGIFQQPVKKHLWFLYALLGMYIVLPFLQCLLKHMPEMLMKYFVVLWFFFLTVDYILSLLHMEVAYDVPLVGTSCYLGYFIMGFLVNNQIKKIPFRVRTCCLLAGFMIMAVIGITYFWSCHSGRHVESIFEYRNILIAAAAIMMFLAVLKNTKRQYSERAKKIIRFVSQHSFTIYLSHILFLDVVKKEMYPRQWSAFIGIPIFAVGVFAAALLFAVVWDFLGRQIKYLK